MTHGKAGQLLEEAWHKLFGHRADPDDAYRLAIVAVEEAGADKVSPKNDKTTLGTMIRDMTAQTNWSVPLVEGGGTTLLAMAKTLWFSWEGRHGGNDYRKATEAEAQTAMFLAVALGQWFSAELIARRVTSPSTAADS